MHVERNIKIKGHKIHVEHFQLVTRAHQGLVIDVEFRG